MRSKPGRMAPSTTQARIALVTLMGVLLAVVAGGVFDRSVPALAIAPALTGVAALAAERLAWRARLLVAVAATVVAVGAIVLLSDGTLGDVVPGLRHGPRRLLTTEWPSPTDPVVVGTVGLLLAVAGAVSSDLAGRLQLRLAPLVPMTLAFVTLLALGAPVQPETWTLVALGAAAIALALSRPSERMATTGRTLLGDRTLPLSAVAIAAGAIAASAGLAWADRADPRMVDDASRSAALIDPIEAAAAIRRSDPELDLFVVTDRSTLIGRSLPARWRLAALTEYDGQRWVPRLTLLPIGRRLGLPPPATPGSPAPIRYDIELLTDDIDLLPVPGRPLTVDAAVETDPDRVVVRLSERPDPGTVVRVEAEIIPTQGDATASPVGTRPVGEISGRFTEIARNLAGDGTALEQLLRIEATMHDDWLLDPGAPGAGHQLALIERFVRDTHRGTEDQFATAFVLLTRSLGFDARVATGFVVPPDQLSTPLTIRSPHAAVWPEVRVEGVGWLPFDPAPALDTTEEDAPTPPPEVQSPAPAQPPVEPPAEEGDASEPDVEVAVEEGSRWSALRGRIAQVAAVAAVGLVPLALVIGGILTIKWWRRRRRVAATDPAHRVRGAWANTTDALVDAGMLIGPAWTDERIASHGAGLVPAVPHELRRLAAMATAMTFGDTADGWRMVDDAAATATAIERAIRAERTRWQRARWRLSLRSLRRATRSPVRA